MENSTDDLNLDAPSAPLSDPWEAAYLRFETREQETQKFIGRLNRLGAPQWPRDSEIVELFCGRGNGLIALGRLGFTRIEGVDLSPRLVAHYRGPAKCIVGDCRQLPFEDCSKDVLIVQGGLHHLPTLPGDLEQTFSEIHRVLRPGGVFLAFDIPDGWIHRVGHIKSTFVPLNPATASKRLTAAGLSNVTIDSKSGGFLIRALRAQ